MKKIILVFLAACLAFSFAACSSKPPVSGGESGMPREAANARRNAPEDVLVGVGTAKLSSLSQSRTLAANRARQEISFTMDSMVKSMIRDYQASSEVDPAAALSFQENISVTLSKSNVNGAVINWEGSDNEGVWWCVVHLSKANVVSEIGQAQAAARLAVPAMASFDAEQRMNEAFEQARKEGW